MHKEPQVFITTMVAELASLGNLAAWQRLSLIVIMLAGSWLKIARNWQKFVCATTILLLLVSQPKSTLLWVHYGIVGLVSFHCLCVVFLRWSKVIATNGVYACLCIMALGIIAQPALSPIPLIIATMAVFAKLWEIQNPDHFAFDLKIVLRIFLALAPVALALAAIFALFPQARSAFFPTDQWDRGYIGVSDHLEPGSLQGLYRNDRWAFFARIHPPNVLKSSDLYWRRMELSVSKGLLWQKGGSASEDIGVQSTSQTAGLITQDIALEDDFPRLLLALDRPVTFNHPNKGNVYQAYSIMEFFMENLSPSARLIYLQTPKNVGPSTKNLTDSWRAQNLTNEGVAGLATAFFNDQKFIYTTETETLSGDRLEQFLFETRRGYCEHYAAAFATLMRLTGVPARVIVGFHGGELNPLTGAYLIRLRDSHAWVEFWSDLRGGWQRVDPAADLMLAKDELSANQNPYFYDSLLSAFAFKLRWTSHQLVEWINQQHPDLGLDVWKAGSAIATLALFLLIVIILRKMRNDRQPPTAFASGKFKIIQSKLLRFNLCVQPGESVGHFLKRCGGQLPSIKDGLDAFIHAYTHLKYADLTAAQVEQQKAELLRATTDIVEKTSLLSLTEVLRQTSSI